MAHARPQNRTNNNPWSFIVREDDGSTFVTAVLNLKESHVLTHLKCKDPEDPKDEKEAYSLAIAYQYVGEPVPENVFKKLGGKLPSPPRRRCYTMLPWSENRGAVLNFAYQRDQNNRLLVGNVYSPGSISHAGDHTDDRELALSLNIPTVGMVPPSPDVDELQQEITRLNTDLQTEQQARATAQRDLAAENRRRRDAEGRLRDEQEASRQLRADLNGLRQQLRVARLGSGSNASQPGSPLHGMNLGGHFDASQVERQADV